MFWASDEPWDMGTIGEREESCFGFKLLLAILKRETTYQRRANSAKKSAGERERIPLPRERHSLDSQRALSLSSLSCLSVL